jgi:hypothetical protein
MPKGEASLYVDAAAREHDLVARYFAEHPDVEQVFTAVHATTEDGSFKIRITCGTRTGVPTSRTVHVWKRTDLVPRNV